jgi:UDP-glucose 4-epimerase
MTVKGLAEEILRLTQSTSKIEYKPERLGDVKHSMASSDKLRGTGWKPAHSVPEGLQSTVAYFKTVIR